MSPVFGEFLGAAGEHIAAAASFRGDLPYAAQCQAVRQLDRLVATLACYMGDLPLPDPFDPSGGPQAGARTRAAPARLALDRAARSLRPGAGGADTDDGHPVVGHLAAAANYLAAGRDLLHTHFTDSSTGLQTPTSWWAPVIISGPVTAALLSELASHTHGLASWIVQLTAKRRTSPGAPTAALMALRDAEPWLRQAAAAMQTAQRQRYPSADRKLLAAIPASIPPPWPALGADEPAAVLCERIPVTAERLRHAALAFAAGARWSPAATSLSWRRDALASAITSHASELVLRTLAERADQLGMQPLFGARLRTAACHMVRVWQSWRAVADQWDIVTTGAVRGAGLTPVAAEIGDLALRAGRLAYRNPHWTPACSHASLSRDPADLAYAPGDIITVLATVHHAADAIGRIAASDRDSVTAAAAENRLYVPVRLLSDKYDIPRPYTPAPRPHTEALLAAYHTAAKAASRVTAFLDDLAVAADAPSSVLAAARQASTATRPSPGRQDNQQAPAQPPIVTPVPGWTEHTLHNLQIRDPALLLRAAVIDEAAHELVTEAVAKIQSRDVVANQTSRSAQVAAAQQDVRCIPRAAQPMKSQVSPAIPGFGSATVVKRTGKRTDHSYSSTRR